MRDSFGAGENGIGGRVPGDSTVGPRPSPLGFAPLRLGHCLAQCRLGSMAQDGSDLGEKSAGAEMDHPDMPAKMFPREDIAPELEVLDTIGTGTFGRVVLCQHKRTSDVCALKVMKITDVLRLKQLQHVHNEKSVLLAVNHPFIVKLYWAKMDSRFLYMSLEYVPGGELFAHLRNAGRFTNVVASFYACEVVSVLDYLHSQSIVYRDLKPENLLLDATGHVKFTDFGFAKSLVDRTWTLCGTPEYLAPEVIQSKGHNMAVDWWALGILIYEMLVGYPPFYDEKPFGIYEKILGGKIEWPRHVDPVAKDLIKRLLVHDRTRRLGSMKNGAEDVKGHRWFKGVQWEDVGKRKLKPPIVPAVSSERDASNYDAGSPDLEHWLTTATVAGDEDLDLFKDF